MINEPLFSSFQTKAAPRNPKIGIVMPNDFTFTNPTT